jgi:hypothetical protein
MRQTAQPMFGEVRYGFRTAARVAEHLQAFFRPVVTSTSTGLRDKKRS